MTGDPSEAIRKAKKRDSHFKENPLRTQASRASYQDSNIFQAKDDSAATVQVSAASQAKDVRVRDNNNSIKSSVFVAESGDSGAVSSRSSNTFCSNTFGQPIVENKGRKNLGG